MGALGEEVAPSTHVEVAAYVDVDTGLVIRAVAEAVAFVIGVYELAVFVSGSKVAADLAAFVLGYQ